MAFKFTKEMATISNNLWAITSAVGAGVCFLVLLVIGAVSLHPPSRAHLDRVSFRIVVYALVANMIFGIASAVGGTRTGPSPVCGVSIFVLQYTLQFSSFLFFCIALNLQLVVVHGVNGQMMERYYLICSAILAMILVIPPYAAGQYGWDPLEQDCWYTNDNRKHRIIWQIATQMGWTFFAVLGEVICSFFVLVFMLKHTGRIRRVFVPARSVSQTSSAPQVFHANRYRNIIFRVALYPIVSCFVNLISVVTALHSTFSNGIQDRTDYNVLLLSDFLYGGRAIVYALLALSDPALVRACREFYSRTKTDSTTGQSTGQSSLSHSHSFHKSRPTQVFVELSTFSPQTDVSPVAVEAAKSGASLADGSSDLEQHLRTDDSRYHHHDGKSTPSPTPTPTPLEQPKSQTHGMVGFVEDSESPPTMAGAQIQRRHTRKGARHQSEGDAFERQI